MPGITWQKSSFSNEQDNCVELRTSSGLVSVRESDDPGAVIAARGDRLAAFMRGIRAGVFERLG